MTGYKQRRYRRAKWWAWSGAACCFGVAILSGFIEPGGWAKWVALALLLAAIVCAVRVAAIVRDTWWRPE